MKCIRSKAAQIGGYLAIGRRLPAGERTAILAAILKAHADPTQTKTSM